MRQTPMEGDVATPSHQNRALSRLLNVVDSLVTDFSSDIDAVLRPVVKDALQEAGDDEPVLLEVLRSFGWQEGRFTTHVDVRALSSRLKALMYDGYVPVGCLLRGCTA